VLLTPGNPRCIMLFRYHDTAVSQQCTDVPHADALLQQAYRERIPKLVAVSVDTGTPKHLLKRLFPDIQARPPLGFPAPEVIVSFRWKFAEGFHDFWVERQANLRAGFRCVQFQYAVMNSNRKFPLAPGAEVCRHGSAA
jgi:hypothetical protein